MIRNYIVVALRNLWRHRGYSLINVLGLAIGLASSILILLYVINELTYDRFHDKSDQIYRVWISGSMPATEMRHAVTSPPMAETMLNDYPEVEQTVRLRLSGGWLVRTGDRIFHETQEDFIFADSTFFDVFSFELLRGDPKSCLRDPRSIVLSEEYAKKYFGDEDPIGQTLKIEQDTNLSVITGVMEDFPVNSHFHCNMIGSLNTLDRSLNTNWVNHNFHTYVVLKEGTDPVEFEARMHEMVIKYVGPIVVQFLGIDLDKFEAAGHSYGYRLQKLTDIHLHSDLQYELEPNGNPMYVYIFLVAAILILVIAGVNFMNLATARSTVRAREVGLRKVVGSRRSQLISQFLTESVLLSLVSMLVALVLVSLLLPKYNNLIQLSLVFDIFSKSWIIPLLILFALFVGIASGSYPAFVLASFKPAAIFSSEKKAASRKSFLRSMLIVFQFTVTIVILLGTIVVNRQLHFMQKKEPGFGKENLLLVKRSDVLKQTIDAFKEEIVQHNNVIAAANTTHVPSNQFSDNVHWLEGRDRGEISTLASCFVSYDFGKAMGLELVSGRFFDPNMPSDSSAVVINEATARALGIEDPLSTRFVQPGENGEEDFFMPIIGVVRDFHYESMQSEINPVVLHFMRGNYEGVLTIKLGDGNKAETISFLEQKWSEFNSEYPFEYFWMDEQFDKLFDTERRTSQILGIFSFLSIFITCLGLLGLISYTTTQRTREIGIRKIMGASVKIVMRLLSREMINLLSISALISIPAFFGVRAWLQRFAYHINFQVGIYFLVLGAVVITILILAMATVSFHSYRAATANPADSLRVD
ncbi:MAG: FtsX-like permease family protein [Bacteroidetes bacterium]|nr:FtsX-like permease family protein [Bacteroidota bacterium]